jgi:spermidine synthase
MKQRALPEVNFSDFGDVRYLHLGTEWVQGSMKLDAPFEIELEYVQRMMAWLLFVDPAEVPKRHAMQLGLGAASLTKFCRKALRMRTTAIELNPQVVAACRGWFKLPADDAKLRVVVADAQTEIRKPAWQGTVDALQVDLYDHEAAAPVLDDAGFYADCERVLAEGGVMTVNLFGRDASLAKSARRIAAAFGASRVRSLQPTREGNTVLLAIKGADVPDRATLVERAQIVESRFGLPARKWLRMIRELPAGVAG